MPDKVWERSALIMRPSAGGSGHCQWVDEDVTMISFIDWNKAYKGGIR